MHFAYFLTELSDGCSLIDDCLLSGCGFLYETGDFVFDFIEFV